MCFAFFSIHLTNDPRPRAVLPLGPPFPVLRHVHGVREVHDALDLVEDVGEHPAEALGALAAVDHHRLIGGVGEGGNPKILCLKNPTFFSHIFLAPHLKCFPLRFALLFQM